MRDRDPEGYYAALNVSPEASAEEIRLSYEFLKRAHLAGQRVNDIPKVLAAYEVLSQPAKRQEYDTGRSASSAPIPRMLEQARPLLGSTVTLAITTVVLAAIVGLFFAPAWVADLRSFSPGDDLVWKENGAPIGRVVAYDRKHEFPNGIRAAGYRIQTDASEPVWMPARDLQRYGTQRQDG